MIFLYAVSIFCQINTTKERQVCFIRNKEISYFIYFIVFISFISYFLFLLNHIFYFFHIIFFIFFLSYFLLKNIFLFIKPPFQCKNKLLLSSLCLPLGNIILFLKSEQNNF